MKSGKSRDSSLSERGARAPFIDSHEVQGCGGSDVLQTGFFEANVARTPQPSASHCLGMSAFDSRASRVLDFKVFGLLVSSGSL